MTSLFDFRTICYNKLRINEGGQMMRLQDQVILITGAATNEGRTTALKLAEEGAIIVATDVQIAELEQLEQELKQISDREHLALIHNISKEIDWERVIDEVLMHYGKIDRLIQFIPHPISDDDYKTVTVDDFRQEMEQSIWGTYLALRNVVPLMEKEKHGTVLTVSYTNDKESSLTYGIEGALAQIMKSAVLDSSVSIKHIALKEDTPFHLEDVMVDMI